MQKQIKIKNNFGFESINFVAKSEIKLIKFVKTPIIPNKNCNEIAKIISISIEIPEKKLSILSIKMIN